MAIWRFAFSPGATFLSNRRSRFVLAVRLAFKLYVRNVLLSRSDIVVGLEVIRCSHGAASFKLYASVGSCGAIFVCTEDHCRVLQVPA